MNSSLLLIMFTIITKHFKHPPVSDCLHMSKPRLNAEISNKFNENSVSNQSTDGTEKWLASLFGIYVFALKFHILNKSTFYGMTSQYLSLPVIMVYMFSKNWAKTLSSLKRTTTILGS